MNGTYQVTPSTAERLELAAKSRIIPSIRLGGRTRYRTEIEPIIYFEDPDKCSAVRLHNFRNWCLANPRLFTPLENKQPGHG